jgi:hypothetical protein
MRCSSHVDVHAYCFSRAPTLHRPKRSITIFTANDVDTSLEYTCRVPVCQHFKGNITFTVVNMLIETNDKTRHQHRDTANYCLKEMRKFEILW